MNKKTIILSSLVFIIFISLILSYFFPNFILSKIILYVNTTSSILIMVLTLVYVITTNLQLSTMKEQIVVMKNEINLQTQPILTPKIISLKLEKIRPFLSPEDKFMKIEILSRFFADFTFNNIGNGAALNVIIFPTIIIDNIKIPSPSLRPELTHCISEKISDECNIHLMMFDNSVEIAKSILDRKAILELKIFYKNIFGIGFYEYISYDIFIKENNKVWKEFLDEGMKKYTTKIKKHDALKPIVKDEADTIFDDIKNDLNNIFANDLDLEYRLQSKSYNIKIIDYENEIKNAEVENENLFKTYFSGRYEIIKKMKV